MGGKTEEFLTTHWSEIHDAQTPDQTRQREIIGRLLARYWKPVYCYLRQKGYDNERSKDLTQGFFQEIVLGRNLILQSKQTKGRFRTFLLTALDHYVTDVYRQETAQKRIPTGHIIQMKTADLFNLPAAQAKAPPDRVFYYAWVANLLEEVLAKVEDEFYSTDKATYWEVFREKVLAPILENVKAPSLKEICAKYGIDKEARASSMILTVKRRFRTVLRSSLRQFVGSEPEIEEEFRELLEILSKRYAR